MPKLDTLEALAHAGQSTTFVRGIVTAPPAGSTGFGVNVSGAVIPVSASESVVVSPGDPVLVALIDSGKGSAEAIVLHRMSTSGLHPAIGVVATVPASSPTITVTGADGASYTAYPFAGYASPAVNDNVELTFSSGTVYCTKANITPAPAQPVGVTNGAVAAPPPPPQTGTTNFAAVDSATMWGPGGWGSYGDARKVYTGSWYGNTVYGAWFYNNGPTQLAGRTITGGRFTLGPRDGGAGNYNSPAQVNIYTHSSPTRPGGDVTLLNGPTTVTAQPYQGDTVYALTAQQALDLVNGGGISIQNGDYAAYSGVQIDASSGLVSIDWSR